MSACTAVRRWRIASSIQGSPGRFVLVTLLAALLWAVSTATAAAQTTAPAPTWVKIADQWRLFNVTGAQRVRYGSGTKWVEKTVNGRGWCTSMFFGRDPARGVAKQCQVATAAVSPPTTPPVQPPAPPAQPPTPPAQPPTPPVQPPAPPAQPPAPPSLPPMASASRPVPNNTAPTSWRFCSQLYTGSGCQFDGMRQVRLGDGTRWITKKVLHRLYAHECSPAFFGGDPAPGASKRCEVAEQREEGTLAVPGTCYNEADGCVTIDLSRIPLGSDGHSTQRLQSGASAPEAVGDGGSFRTTCEFSHMAFNDPIVFPNQPGRSHLHVFYGNTAVDAFSTPESIASTGNSTCAGGTANRTSYWIPALVDTRTGVPIVPDNAIWYYKTFKIPAHPLTRTEPLPTGLRMIAGDMHATSRQSMTEWGCVNGGSGGSSESVPTTCPVGSFVEMRVRFPSCWDGKNLDSADHKSHMSFSRGAEGCPASHPRPVPQITLNVRYLVQNVEDPRHWRLSSDHMGRPSGLSSHADWFDGWVPSVRDTWVENCSKVANNCGTDNLGNGTRLY